MYGLGSIQGETGADTRSMYGNNVQVMVEASRSQKMMILYPRRWVVTVAIPTETVVAYCSAAGEMWGQRQCSPARDGPAAQQTVKRL